MKIFVVLLFVATVIIEKSFGEEDETKKDCDRCTEKLKSSIDKYRNDNKDKEVEIPGPVFCPTLKVKGLGSPKTFEKSCITDSPKGQCETQRMVYNDLTITTDCKIDGLRKVIKPQIEDEVKKFPDYMEKDCKKGPQEPIIGAGRTVVDKLNNRDFEFEQKQKNKPESEKDTKDDKDIHAVMKLTNYQVDIKINNENGTLNLEFVCPNQNITKNDMKYETKAKSVYANAIAAGFKDAEMAKFIANYAIKYLYEDGSGVLAGSMKKLAADAKCVK